MCIQFLFPGGNVINYAELKFVAPGKGQKLTIYLGMDEFLVLGLFKFKIWFNYFQVSLRLTVESGQVLIMPTTFEPGEEATFTFRVFSRFPVRIRILDVVPAVIGSVFSRVQEMYGNSFSKSQKDFRQYEPLFNQVSCPIFG